jgi:hypothetical protein
MRSTARPRARTLHAAAFALTCGCNITPGRRSPPPCRPVYGSMAIVKSTSSFVLRCVGVVLVIGGECALVHAHGGSGVVDDNNYLRPLSPESVYGVIAGHCLGWALEPCPRFQRRQRCREHARHWRSNGGGLATDGSSRTTYASGTRASPMPSPLFYYNAVSRARARTRSIRLIDARKVYNG